MAVMSETDRWRCWATIMRRQTSAVGCVPPDISKTELRAAIDAADSWADANQVSFNTALPTAFKNAADPDQKTLLLAYVLMRRAGILQAEED